MSAVFNLSGFLAQQQVLTGMVGAAVVGSALFALRQIPGQLATAIRETATVSLVIENDEEPFKHMAGWLAQHGGAKKARRVMLAENYDYDAGQWRWSITLGQGWHIVWRGRLPLLVHRFVQDAEGLGKIMGAGRRERLTLISLGRSQAPIRSILEEARKLYWGDGRINVYSWCDGSFLLADKLFPRPFETVFLPQEEKDALVADVERFLGARDHYRRRGTPWRRGYLFEGPPGTGKTTLIHVMASIAKRSLYVINLNSISSDGELTRATNMIGPDGMLVIEDIDSAKITHDRDVVEAQAAASPIPGVAAAPGQGPKTGPSLSGLLNAIDGVTAREGRILCITSNHADKLDPALLRPGRVDLRMQIKPLGAGLAWEMFKAFRPDGGPGDFAALIAGATLPMPASAMQNLLLSAERESLQNEEAA